MRQNAVRVVERAARRHDVVQNESALVHLGEEVRAKRAIAQGGAQEQQDAGNGQPQRTRSACSSNRRCACKIPRRRRPGSACVEAAAGRSTGEIARARSASRSSKNASPGVHVTASTSEVRSDAVIVTASARKKLPVPPSPRSAEEDDDRRHSGADQRPPDLAECLADGFRPRLAGIAVQHYILDHNNRIVDHEPDRRGSPPNVIRLKLSPMTQRNRTVTATVTESPGRRSARSASPAKKETG